MKTKGTGPLSRQIQSDMSHRPSGPGELDPSCQLRSDQARPVTTGAAIQWLKSVMMMHLPALWGLVPSTRGSRTSRNHSDLSKCTPPCHPYHWNTAKGTTMRKVSCKHPRKIVLFFVVFCWLITLRIIFAYSINSVLQRKMHPLKYGSKVNKSTSGTPEYRAQCWSMLLYAYSMTRPVGSFQIPFLGLRPLLIAWKVSLISLPRCIVSTSVWYEDWFFFRVQYHSGSKQSLLFFRKACMPDFIIQVQNNHYCSSEKHVYQILSTDKVLPAIRSRGQSNLSKIRAFDLASEGHHRNKAAELPGQSMLHSPDFNQSHELYLQRRLHKMHIKGWKLTNVKDHVITVGFRLKKCISSHEPSPLQSTGRGAGNVMFWISITF